MTVTTMKSSRMVAALLLGAAVLGLSGFGAVAQVLNGGGTEAAPAPAEPATADTGPVTFSQITKIYGNWSMQCEERAGDSACFVETVVRQNAQAANGQQRDLIVMRVSRQGDAIRAGIVTPNRVLLRNGVVLKMADAEQKGDYFICGPVNCNAVVDFTPEFLDAMSQGKDMTVSVFVADRKVDGGVREVPVPLSLNGFGAALENLKAID